MLEFARCEQIRENLPRKTLWLLILLTSGVNVASARSPQKRRDATSDATSVTDATRPLADEHESHLRALHALTFVSLTVSKPGQPVRRTVCQEETGGARGSTPGHIHTGGLADARDVGRVARAELARGARTVTDALAERGAAFSEHVGVAGNRRAGAGGGGGGGGSRGGVLRGGGGDHCETGKKKMRFFFSGKASETTRCAHVCAALYVANSVTYT
jgi:hypothetical protein